MARAIDRERAPFVLAEEACNDGICLAVKKETCLQSVPYSICERVL